MRDLALFAGAGGSLLAGELLGLRTVCAVECDAYARDVLVDRQNDGCLPPFPIWDDACTFDGRPWRGAVDIVSGGFPCTDISIAGKGAGIDGKESRLWQEQARIIGEVRPAFAFVENSPALAFRGLDRVLGDLSALGFDAAWRVVSAAQLGAPHRRLRMWILAHAEGNRRQRGGQDPSERKKGGHAVRLLDAARLFPTPTAACASGGQTSRSGARKGELLLAGAVRMWPTPHGMTPDGRTHGPSGNELGRAVNRSLFPTPTSSMATVQDMEQARYAGNGGRRPAYAHAFPTPKGRDWKGQSQRGIHAPGDALPNMDRGDGSPVGGSLNPAWVEWLMGWPLGWTRTGRPIAARAWAAWRCAFATALAGCARSATAGFRSAGRSPSGCSCGISGSCGSRGLVAAHDGGTR